MEILFFIFLLLAVYSYLIFPAILWILQLFVNKSWEKSVENLPSVSVIISAYNEQIVIGDKVRNALQLDYPSDLLEIIVASDGSNWDAMVRRYSDDQQSIGVKGSIGCLTNGELLPDLEDALLELEPGRVSRRVVETPSGFHILYWVK